MRFKMHQIDFINFWMNILNIQNNIWISGHQKEFMHNKRNKIYLTVYPNSSLILNIEDFTLKFKHKIKLHLFMNKGSKFILMTTNPYIVLNIQYIHPEVDEIDLMHFESHLYSNHQNSDFGLYAHLELNESVRTFSQIIRQKFIFSEPKYNTVDNWNRFFLSFSERLKLAKTVLRGRVVDSAPPSSARTAASTRLTNSSHQPTSTSFSSASPFSFSGNFSLGGVSFINSRISGARSIIFGDTYDSGSDSEIEEITPAEWRIIERIQPVPRKTIPTKSSSSNSKKRMNPIVPIDGKHEECMLCCENLADIVVSPCSHRFCCNVCFNKLAEPKKCSECRDLIEDYISTKPFCKQRTE